MLTVILHVFARLGPEKQLVGFSSILAVLWRRFSGPYGRPRASRKGGPRRLDTGIRLLAQNLFCTLDSVQGIGLVAQNLFHTSCLLRRCCKVLHEPSAEMTTADFALTRHYNAPCDG